MIGNFVHPIMDRKKYQSKFPLSDFQYQFSEEIWFKSISKFLVSCCHNDIDFTKNCSFADFDRFTRWENSRKELVNQEKNAAFAALVL